MFFLFQPGSLLPHNTTGREYTHTAEEWCGAYVTAGNVKSKCAANRRVGNVCRNPTRESRSWPPVIKSDSHYYYALISYTFLDCPTILLTKTTPPATTTGLLQLLNNFVCSDLIKSYRQQLKVQLLSNNTFQLTLHFSTSDDHSPTQERHHWDANVNFTKFGNKPYNAE